MPSDIHLFLFWYLFSLRQRKKYIYHLLLVYLSHPVHLYHLQGKKTGRPGLLSLAPYFVSN